MKIFWWKNYHGIFYKGVCVIDIFLNIYVNVQEKENEDQARS